MNDTDAIRARLAVSAAAEEASPSPVWEPVDNASDLEDVAGQTLTLAVDGPLRDALAYLARGTDGTLEETARKAILDAALHTRADDITFTHTVAAHTA